MKKGVFISYSVKNNDKKELLKLRLKNSKFLFPIVIADYNENMKCLADKIIEGIINADYFIPIITEQSKENQWVNQEIGFAKCKSIDDLIEIIPIVESSLLKDDKLKGFINNQLDLPYNFYENDKTTKFEDITNTLVSELEFRFSKKDKLIKFSDDTRRFLFKDNVLLQFPDKRTREIFGYDEQDVLEIPKSEIKKYIIKSKIESITKTTIVELNKKFYAKFNNELKLIPTKLTLKYIKDFNKSNTVVMEK